jgi:succinate dehydrogenase / fumarate reductase, flavoprotein subunit
LYAMGESAFTYHGANRLGANSLLSCIFDGLFGGPCIRTYINETAVHSAADVPESVYANVVAQEKSKVDALVNAKGDVNPYALWTEMGKLMTENCTVIKYNDRLRASLEACEDWKARYKRVKLSDTGMWTNQNLSFTRALGDMIRYAETQLKASLMRDESRGAHYKPEFPTRDDAKFLKTTIAKYEPTTDTTSIHFAEVDISLVPPRDRTYGKGTGAAAAKKEPSATAPKPQLAGV